MSQPIASTSEMNGAIKDVLGRLKWATSLRDKRIDRELAYRSSAECYEKMMDRMWSRVALQNERPPRPQFSFDKKTATATLFFERDQGGKRSHIWRLGDPHDERNAGLLQDLNRKEAVPYFISDEIIVATAIASMLSDKETATEEEAKRILFDYYETEPYSPLDLSRVWMSRLNSTLCSIWRMAPIMKRTIEISQERGIKHSIAQKMAMEEVEASELPKCLNSDNGDGRINMSYPGSCFYTIDHHGIAICKEFPNEHLDLSSYDSMKIIASTIYRDITLAKDLDDTGISGALLMIEEEPAWSGGNLFPWERSSTKMYAVLFLSGADNTVVNVFDTKEDAKKAFEIEVDLFAKGRESYSNLEAVNAKGEATAGLSLVEMNEEYRLERYIECWNQVQGYYKP